MCLAKAVLKKSGQGDELVMENIASMELDGKRVVFTDIMFEKKELEATVKKIDFTNSSITLE